MYLIHLLGVLLAVMHLSKIKIYLLGLFYRGGVVFLLNSAFSGYFIFFVVEMPPPELPVLFFQDPQGNSCEWESYHLQTRKPEGYRLEC